MISVSITVCILMLGHSHIPTVGFQSFDMARYSIICNTYKNMIQTVHSQSNVRPKDDEPIKQS